MDTPQHTFLDVAGQRLMRLADNGPLLAGEQDVTDLLGLTWGEDVDWIVLPVRRLPADFFRLETRIAGNMLQKLTNYRMKCAIVGDISAPLAASGALRDFVRESNQGRAVWFADDMDALSQRLAQADASATAATSDIYDFQRGNAPLLISIPHLGSQLPDAQRARMTEAGLRSGDTDWHLDTLYGWARALGASVLGARYSRYVVDLNRPSDDASLYPGQTKTGLCPTHTFRGEPIYRDGAEPDEAERARRLDSYWRPYHDKLRLEIERIRAEHGAVLLWEAHSIASVLPRLFEGKLPDLNIGTADGASCAPDVLDAIRQRLEGAAPYTWAVNGRFKGGHITRHYGRPGDEVHAVQLEMCQSTYMDETYPYAYRPELAARVTPVVEGMVGAALERISARGR